MPNLTIIGAGAWGTALAIQAARAGRQVRLWARTPFEGRVSPRLPGHPLPAEVALAGDLPETAEPTLLAVPMQHLRGILTRLRARGPLLLCCKGIESGTGRLPLEILAELHPGIPGAVLSGPNLAHEIAAGLPAASVIAGAEAAVRRLFIEAIGSPAFRLYGNADPIGVQFGGAAKNVIAIAAGIVTGLALGENARAALVNRGLAEIARLVHAEGGRAETIFGLSGLGDLMLTCTAPTSRNFSHGVALAHGPAPIDANGPVIEGVATAPALLARAAGLDLPICAEVAACLAGQSTAREAVGRLLGRKLKDEGIVLF